MVNPIAVSASRVVVVNNPSSLRRIYSTNSTASSADLTNNLTTIQDTTAGIARCSSQIAKVFFIGEQSTSPDTKTFDYKIFGVNFERVGSTNYAVLSRLAEGVASISSGLATANADEYYADTVTKVQGDTAARVISGEPDTCPACLVFDTLGSQFLYFGGNKDGCEAFNFLVGYA